MAVTQCTASTIRRSAALGLLIARRRQGVQIEQKVRQGNAELVVTGCFPRRREARNSGPQFRDRSPRLHNRPQAGGVEAALNAGTVAAAAMNSGVVASVVSTISATEIWSASANRMSVERLSMSFRPDSTCET